MKAWVIGDSFGTPCRATTRHEAINNDFYDGVMPGNDSVVGKEWVKQVTEGLGYEYSIETNWSVRACGNEHILHKIDWLINNDHMFDKNTDILIIIPTVGGRFMFKGLNDIKPFKFDYIEEPHMHTAGAVNTNIQTIDEYSTLHRDQEFEIYKMISAYDKLLSHLKLYDIKYLFCPGMWSSTWTGELDYLDGYTPSHIELDFPSYNIGLEADQTYIQNNMNKDITGQDWIYDHFAVAEMYTNHMSHIGNDVFAKAVLEYFNERS
tara:strand:+ start:317 stop:1108 length:792 start_codon:yes stop_codon:yes gene_type:complete